MAEVSTTVISPNDVEVSEADLTLAYMTNRVFGASPSHVRRFGMDQLQFLLSGDYPPIERARVELGDDTPEFHGHVMDEAAWTAVIHFGKITVKGSQNG